MNTRSHYDVAIIGAGMSGLAAGIRLAHFDRKVCIFERHNAVGGLNSFYSIAGRRYDVGLHAVTNYVPAGVKGTPLGKILRQLRIEREEFALCPQKRSRVAFGPTGELSLAFSNDFALLESEVARVFPPEIEGFRRLTDKIRAFDDVSLDAVPVSARDTVRAFIRDPVLEDMLFCPLMYYGSARTHDMEFGQFAIMFKALFTEGFARPFEGVRVILRVLLDKYRKAGGERRMKCGIDRIVSHRDRATALVLETGEEITADHVLSSAGLAETERIISRGETPDPATPGVSQKDESRVQAAIGATAPDPVRLSFAETITILDREPAALGLGEDTIVFFNDSTSFSYERPAEVIDPRSGVICIPNNFVYPAGQRLPEGILRVTCLANHARWTRLSEEDYRREKARWFDTMQTTALRFLPRPSESPLAPFTVATDMFTPRTVEKFTGHIEGAIYGSPTKVRTGRTSLSNVYLCGTDQGFLGIIGAMLSGISMANYHILMR